MMFLSLLPIILEKQAEQGTDIFCLRKLQPKNLTKVKPCWRKGERARGKKGRKLWN